MRTHYRGNPEWLFRPLGSPSTSVFIPAGTGFHACGIPRLPQLHTADYHSISLRVLLRGASAAPGKILKPILNKTVSCRNRSRVSVIRVVERVKTSLTSSFITGQDLVVVSHTVRAHVKDPIIWGRLGSRPLRRGSVWPSRNTLLRHMCYTPNFVALCQTVLV